MCNKIYLKYYLLTLVILSIVLVYLVLISSKKTIDNKDTITGLIECVKGDTIKFEYNFKLKKIIPDSINGLTRIIPIPYPYAYGFVPGIKSLDGDFLDSFFISSNKLSRGDQLNFYPSYAIFMLDNEEEDTKKI